VRTEFGVSDKDSEHVTGYSFAIGFDATVALGDFQFSAGEAAYVAKDRILQKTQSIKSSLLELLGMDLRKSNIAIEHGKRSAEWLYRTKLGGVHGADARDEEAEGIFGYGTNSKRAEKYLNDVYAGLDTMAAFYDESPSFIRL